MAQGWSWPRIKARLEEAGTSLKQLAVDAGYHPASFSNAKLDISPPIQQIIADALGIQPKTLWPDRYYRNGRPKPGRRRRPLREKSYVSKDNKKQHEITPGNGGESRLNSEAA
ncbi:MAG: hypothetical protein HOK30_15470 [Rhodospirillaceae bacterium]|jgi:Ner family transcriptional regulator|nr:hypothetical protein [Rhodospirillaceae bacterium]